MARIFIDSEWYEALDSNSLYEFEYENIILEQSEALYPGFKAVPFKVLLFSTEDSARADLTLIHEDYREWWVVEVELSHHSLENHILPQVRTLSEAFYGDNEAHYILQQNSSFDRTRLCDMMKGIMRRVLVITNKWMKDWRLHLSRYNAELSILEIYKSHKNRYAYYFDGFVPYVDCEVLTRCQIDSAIPRFLKIFSPGGLGIERGDKIQTLYQDSIVEWERFDNSDTVWLLPVTRNPITSRELHEMVRLSDGRIELRKCQICAGGN